MRGIEQIVSLINFRTLSVDLIIFSFRMCRRIHINWLDNTSFRIVLQWSIIEITEQRLLTNLWVLDILPRCFVIPDVSR